MDVCKAVNSCREWSSLLGRKTNIMFINKKVTPRYGSLLPTREGLAWPCRLIPEKQPPEAWKHQATHAGTLGVSKPTFVKVWHWLKKCVGFPASALLTLNLLIKGQHCWGAIPPSRQRIQLRTPLEESLPIK